MLQDIAPKIMHNQYCEKEVNEESVILCFDKNTVLTGQKQLFPKWKEFEQTDRLKDALTYLFSIDGQDYFLAPVSEALQLQGYEYVNVRALRDTAKGVDCFAAATGYHLFVWYRDNQFCGRCGQRLVKDTKERMMRCSCGNMVFPKIAPAVIVGIIDQAKHRILMTKYAGREYKKYALVAGFTEIGETAEETVAREVMEEVGLKVKNIRYYKSQPWGFDSNLLMGFFADLDGSDEIRRDASELAVAEWIAWKDTKGMDDGASLTRAMIQAFYTGEA